MLGTWSAADRNIDIARQYWELVKAHWLGTQYPDGGWGYGYGGQDRSYGSMTAAGLATLFVCIDMIHGQDFSECGHNPESPPIVKALDWLAKNYDPAKNVGLPEGRMCSTGYYLFACERVGLASGRKFFGDTTGSRRAPATSCRTGPAGRTTRRSACCFCFAAGGRCCSTSWSTPAGSGTTARATWPA